MTTTRRSSSFATVLALGMMTTLGCATGAWSDDDDPFGSSSSLIVENAHQHGAMGDVHAYAGTTFMEAAHSYDGFTQVRLDSEGDGWWVMTSLEISGVDLRDLEPGHVYATSSSGAYDPDEPQVSVVGCSGPEYPRYTYDTHAERTELEVHHLDDGTMRVLFRAWFEGNDGSEQLAEGSFDVRGGS